MQTLKTVDELFYRELGQELRDLRYHRGLTLKEVSNLTGYSRTLIDHWELGFNKIKKEQFERICEALQVTGNLQIDVKLGFWRE